MASWPASLCVSSSVISSEGGVPGDLPPSPFLRADRTMQAPSLGHFAARNRTPVWERGRLVAGMVSASGVVGLSGKGCLALRLLLGPVDEAGGPAQGITCLAG